MENLIEHMALAVLQHDGINYQSEKDARRHLERIKADLHQGLRQGNQMLTAGLHYLKELGDGFAASFSAKVLKQIKSSKKLARLIEEEIVQNQQAMPLFLDGIKPFLETDDAHREQCVLSVLMALFPGFPQPYIFSANLIWREHGIDVAEAFYTKLVEAIEDPALDYFAADCFFKNGKTGEAKRLLDRALGHDSVHADNYEEIRMWASSLRKQC